MHFDNFPACPSEVARCFEAATQAAASRYMRATPKKTACKVTTRTKKNFRAEAGESPGKRNPMRPPGQAPMIYAPEDRNYYGLGPSLGLAFSIGKGLK